MSTEPPPFLWQVSPDDPNHAKYVPITFRLNARSIVAYLADDLRKGKAAHLGGTRSPRCDTRRGVCAQSQGGVPWVEVAHGGLMGAETVTAVAEAAQVVALVGGIAASFLVLAGGFMELAEADRGRPRRLRRNTRLWDTLAAP